LEKRGAVHHFRKILAATEGRKKATSSPRLGRQQLIVFGGGGGGGNKKRHYGNRVHEGADATKGL